MYFTLYAAALTIIICYCEVGLQTSQLSFNVARLFTFGNNTLSWNSGSAVMRRGDSLLSVVCIEQQTPAHLSSSPDIPLQFFLSISLSLFQCRAVAYSRTNSHRRQLDLKAQRLKLSFFVPNFQNLEQCTIYYAYAYQLDYILAQKFGAQPQVSDKHRLLQQRPTRGVAYSGQGRRRYPVGLDGELKEAPPQKKNS